MVVVWGMLEAVYQRCRFGCGGRHQADTDHVILAVLGILPIACGIPPDAEFDEWSKEGLVWIAFIAVVL